jgi:hypothetical protein
MQNNPSRTGDFKAGEEGGGLSPYKHAFVLTKKQEEVTLLGPTTWASSTYCVTQQHHSLTPIDGLARPDRQGLPPGVKGDE